MNHHPHALNEGDAEGFNAANSARRNQSCMAEAKFRFATGNFPFVIFAARAHHINSLKGLL